MHCVVCGCFEDGFPNCDGSGFGGVVGFFGCNEAALEDDLS